MVFGYLWGGIGETPRLRLVRLKSQVSKHFEILEYLSGFQLAVLEKTVEKLLE